MIWDEETFTFLKYISVFLSDLFIIFFCLKMLGFNKHVWKTFAFKLKQLLTGYSSKHSSINPTLHVVLPKDLMEQNNHSCQFSSRWMRNQEGTWACIRNTCSDSNHFLSSSKSLLSLPDGKWHSNKTHISKTSVEMFIVHLSPKQLLKRMYSCRNTEIKVYVQLMESFTSCTLHRLQHW